MKVILDSGAFSAWMKQTEIDIEAYANFCLANLDHIDYIVNLDVIPGKWGEKKLTQEQVIASAKKGWENYRYLVNKGLPKEKIIHVFHQDEPFSVLERMVYEFDYIGLAPSKDRTTQEKIQFLDVCMNYVCHSDGMPKIKFHGFGVTSMPILFRFPWFSCDSTSWVKFGKYGIVLFPKRKYGKYRYDLSPYTIKVSSRSPAKAKADKHIDTMSPTENDWFVSMIEEKGFKLGQSFFETNEKGKQVEIVKEEGLSNSGVQRDRWNLLYYLNIEQSVPKWPWAFKFEDKHTLF